MVWLKIVLSLLILYLLMSVVKFSLRKIFKIEKEKQDWFSYNHINKTHKKVDWVLRSATTVLLIAISYLVIFKEYSIIFYLVPVILLSVADYAVKAFFEWKYSDNPKQSILTIGELAVLATVTAVIIQFDLLNLV